MSFTAYENKHGTKSSKTYDIGICSGYFNPPTDGHVDYIGAAAKQCEKLFVIINNDMQVKNKGGISLLNVNLRYEIMSQWKNIDVVVISLDYDETVCKTLKYICEMYRGVKGYKDSPIDSVAFFNSGDRKKRNEHEHGVCKKLGIDEVFLDLPKINSSSKIINRAFEDWVSKTNLDRELQKKVDKVTINNLMDYLNQATKAVLDNVISKQEEKPKKDDSARIVNRIVNQYIDMFGEYFVNKDELKDKLVQAKEKIQNARRVFLVGNGGSESVCSHLAQDLFKTAGIPSYSMEGSSLITACANDFGYDKAYTEWLKLNQFNADKGDILIAISSSGNSKNIFNTILFANKRHTIALTAFDEKNSINNMCGLDLPHAGVRFHIPTQSYGIAECYHAIILHMILDVIMEENTK